MFIGKCTLSKACTVLRMPFRIFCLLLQLITLPIISEIQQYNVGSHSLSIQKMNPFYNANMFSDKKSVRENLFQIFLKPPTIHL